MERITKADLKRAIYAHVNALAYAGIAYDGRLGLQEGSKPNGIAYRLYRTDVMDRCQARAWNESHEGCERCGGTGMAKCSGHYAPPIGSDFLGMTAREAYAALTARTDTIYAVAREMRKSAALASLKAAQNA